MPATLLWFTGFETADPEFALSVVTSPVRADSGVYACKIHGADSDAGPNPTFLDGNATMYMRFFLYPTANPAGTVRLCGGGTSSFTPKFRLYWNSDGTLTYAFGNSTPIATGATPLTLNAYNLIELKFVRDASVGGLEVYLNDALQFSSFAGSTTSGTSTAAGSMNFFFLDSSIDFSGMGDCYLDDCAVAIGGYIGSADSTIAIGGKAGAPTYDAWAKSSGSDAYALWNTVPYDVTKYCESGVDADKQTMLLIGGIPEGSVIGGAYVKMVGERVAFANEGFQILKRLASVDTLTATFGTFSQNPFRAATALFTDTVANLNGMEIGSKKIGSSNTPNVYQILLELNYTPPPPIILTSMMPSMVESLGWVTYRTPTMFETLGQTLLRLRVPSLFESLGWIFARASFPLESWIALRHRLLLQVETDGIEADALAVLWQVLRAGGTPGAAYDPLFVRFSTLAPFIETMGALTVTFNAWRPTEDGLQVRFDALDGDLIALATSGAVQAPVAVAPVTQLDVWGITTGALAIRFDVEEP
jgi:hypothetical protein